MWPREPDLAVIKSLAMEHLASELPHPFNGTEPKISDFACGAFNKLYLVSYSGHDVSYLFRATLPVIPFYKTESEVATLAYLRAETSIPVPRAIAWDSNADNDLGFEWILMDKVAGVELRSVWRRIPWERKLELVDELAGFIHQLHAHTVSAIGSLYFKSALESIQGGKNQEAIDALFEEPSMEDGSANGEAKDGSHPSWIPMPKIQGAQGSYRGDSKAKEGGHDASAFKLQGDDEFVVGPIFSWIFWKGSRLYVQGNRGPYQSCSEWYRALIEMQINWVKAGPVEDDSDYDSDFEKESPDLLAWCQQYLDILQTICPQQEDHSPSSLHHHDLNDANILVDPETFSITGIVDWETVNILPNWRVTDYPEFIDSCDPPSETEPEIPDYSEGWTPEVDTRDMWDNRILRGRFDQAMKQLSISYESPTISKSRQTKRLFEAHISDLTDWPKRSQNWLRRYRDTINAEKKIEEKREKLGEDGVGTSNGLMTDVPAVEQNGFNNTAPDELEINTTAQIAKQATPLVIVTEPQLVNGHTASDQLTKEEALSPNSATTISSWSSTSLEDSDHKTTPDRPDFPEPKVGEKVWIGGSSSGSESPEEAPMQLAKVIANIEVEEATSSNVSEVGTDYTAPNEKTAPMDGESPTSSNSSETGAEYTKPTEKTGPTDKGSPSCSSVGEAGSDGAPLVRNGGYDWMQKCRMS